MVFSVVARRTNCPWPRIGISLRPQQKEPSRLCVGVRSFASQAETSSSNYQPLPKELPLGTVLKFPHRRRAIVIDAKESPVRDGFSVAVIGAAGEKGRQIVTSLATKNRLFAGMGAMTIKLVAGRSGAMLARCIGLCTELRDAFDEFCPHLEVVPDLESVQADIIVMAAGATLSHNFKTHAELARVNFSLFDQHASILVANNKRSLVVVVSSPAEFGVDRFIDAGFDPERVLGAGAYFDSLRFRREIASELGLPRQKISGLVLGMHGLNMVPCWSTVNLSFVKDPLAEERLEKLKKRGLARTPLDVDQTRSLAYEVRGLAEKGNALAATALVNQQPPDLRAAIRRYVSYFSGPTYPRVGIGEKVAALILDVMKGNDLMIAAQVRINFLGSERAIGSPVLISGRGVKIAHVQLTESEEEAVRSAALEAKWVDGAINDIKALRALAKQRGKA
eukprot:TRINITY_DN70437_c0_g1_i1.p1 TRINITY_DN70437_c0_g1~~TRINITY_DN70437_c0_g1_i1.p1  ORF type:complete len:450 (+),score=75.35 TRINITY_DN70437_c0_g1_i1:44-1393(+)